MIDICDSCGDWTKVSPVTIKTKSGETRKIYLCKHCKEYLDEAGELIISVGWTTAYKLEQ